MTSVRQDGGQEVLLALECTLPDEGDAREFARWLKANNAQDIGARRGMGIDPLITPIVVTAVLAISLLAKVVLWIRDRTACQLIIDARDYPNIRKHLDCRVRDGRVIILAGQEDRVELLELPSPTDLQGVLESVIAGN